VFTSANGKQALEIVNNEPVDIIVTDISMPEMDGLELCEQLKTNFETSHIPVIILSAHASIQSKIAGMEYGADIYIEKPFSLEFLISCIDGLLSKRQKLREAYSSEIKPTPKHASLSARDEQFLLSLDEIILSNMSDPEFSIEQLAENLCLSKSTLNRKVKGLLQITPNDYIRTKRLIMAAKLLEEGSNRINETCYLVGFNTPSYFIKCFKSYYGKLPSEYIEENKQ
jgi:YesN/AraC family two-component response regulator